MAYMSYPGYEIERFEDEGGQCYLRLIPKSSEEEVDNNEASQLRESESSQESTEMEQHDG